MTHTHAHTHASDTHARATWLLTQCTHTHSIIVNRGQIVHPCLTAMLATMLTQA